jgi:spermidine synthase
LPLICLCFFLSGVAALIYQIAWTRQFALVFGTSELAVAAVLGAYMGGLALGAALIERWLARIQKPLRNYAWLELGIAMAALLVPVALMWAGRLLVWMYGHQNNPPEATIGAVSLLQLLSAFVILLAPTTLMGASLPLLTRYAVRVDRQIGQRVGLLYACNTAGAVLGALAGALWVLPALGLTRTVWIAAAINTLAAVLVFMMARHAVPSAAQRSTDHGAGYHWIMPLMLVSGAVSFLHEVLWTRMLSHLLGSSLYAFGVMLASFLAGIAMGGALGGMLARRRDSAIRWLAISEFATACAAILAWWLLSFLPSNDSALWQRVAYAACLLFPLAFAIGLSYPLAVRILASDVDSAATSSARVYSWNTVGAIVGALSAGFIIVPATRYEGAARLAVACSALLAVALAVFLWRRERRFALILAAAATLLAALFHPIAPESLLRYSTLQVSGEGELLHYSVGKSAAVVALRQGSQLAIRTNGLPEALVDVPGRPPQPYVEAWMAPLAVLARPQLRSMLVVGLGGGRVLEAVPPSVATVDVIELEAQVVAANRAIGLRRQRDPLDDERMHLIVNDARGSLTLTDKRYDAIVSQPSHPWTAGASHLYTREFMLEARAHLNVGGLLVQWMNVALIDEALLRSLLATVSGVFSEVQVYRPAPATLLLLASDAPFEPEQAVTRTQAVLDTAPQHYARLGLNVPEDLAAALAMDSAATRAFAGAAAPITDDTNRFATLGVYERGRSLTTARAGQLLEPYDPLLRTARQVAMNSTSEMGLAYMARRIAAAAPLDSSVRKRLTRLASHFEGEPLEVYLKSLIVASAGKAAEALEVRQIGATLFPESDLLANGGEHATVVQQAALLAAQNRWLELEGLDAGLAAIPWIAESRPLASQLQAQWRLSAPVTDHESTAARAAEALALIDRIGLIAPSAELASLRALASERTAQPALQLESIAFYLMQRSAAANDQATLFSLGQMLARIRAANSVDGARFAEVWKLWRAATKAGK